MRRRDDAGRVQAARGGGQGARAAVPEGAIREPDVEATVSILQGLKPKFEAHRIRVLDSALVAAARLSDRASRRGPAGQGHRRRRRAAAKLGNEVTSRRGPRRGRPPRDRTEMEKVGLTSSLVETAPPEDNDARGRDRPRARGAPRRAAAPRGCLAGPAPASAASASSRRPSPQSSRRPRASRPTLTSSARRRSATRRCPRSRTGWRRRGRRSRAARPRASSRATP